MAFHSPRAVRQKEAEAAVDATSGVAKFMREPILRGGDMGSSRLRNCVQLAIRERAVTFGRGELRSALVLPMIFSIQAARTIHRWCGHHGATLLPPL
jgi:hypothetical protein